MSTLNVNFASDDRVGFIARHLANWLEWRVPLAEQAQAKDDILRAMASDPSMPEWADWPAMREKGRWLRKQKVNPVNRDHLRRLLDSADERDPAGDIIDIPRDALRAFLTGAA